MYAVIKSGGKQHRVKAGDVISVEKLMAGQGDTLTFDQVLMIGNGDDIKVGAPLISGATVIAEVVEQYRDKKVRIMKFHRRKHHMKRQGHRQYLTKVQVKEIKG